MAHIRSTFVAFLLSTLAILGAGAAAAQPSFSKVFNPSTVGPNGTTGLTYTIDNSSGSAITSMNFANTLPAGLTVAGPAQTDCSDAALSAAGSSVSLTSARLFAGGICTVSVPIAVANAGPATITNPAVTLNNNVGAVSSVARDLTVDTGRAGFSKVFAPDAITVGQTTRLTYTVDNTANSNQGNSLTFQDNLPNGLAVADPPNATHNCIDSFFTGGTFAPVAGSQAIAATNAGIAAFAVAAGASCTFAVDVTGTVAGSYVSKSGNLSGNFPFSFLSAGSAIDSITVTGASAGQLAIVKDYTNDPVGPGGNVTLRFDLTNTDRDFPASNVAFADNLAADLTGATVSGVVSNTCGGSVTGTGTGSVGFSGGTIGAQGSCRVEIGIDIPSSATPGSYTTTLDSASATVNGSSVSGNLPAAQLTIRNASPLVFTKSVVGSSTLVPGDTLTFRYAIQNPNGSGIDFSNVAFIDTVSGFFGDSFASTIPSVAASNCGSPSIALSAQPFSSDRSVSFSGGAVLGGETCTFEAEFTIPSDTPSGTVTSTTSTLSGENGGQTISIAGASASFTVNGGALIRFSKAFASASATAGSSVDLTFTITSEAESASNVTGLTFTDDLDAFLTGAVATGLPLSDVCGTGSQITGTDTLTLTGGNLTPGTSCTITVPVSIPVSATTAEATNTTSALTGTITGGGALSISPATATLDVLGLDDQPLTLAAEFLPSTNLPGGTGTVRYTISNPNTSSAGTISVFTHSLTSTLSGLSSTNAASPTTNTCGSSVSGTTFIIVTGGSVAAGASCVIEIDYLVPGGAASGDYGGTTSALNSDVNGAKTADAAAASLTIVTDPLSATKSFNLATAGATDTVVVTVELSNTLAPGIPATAVSFTDDLENNFLTGAVGTGQVSNSCGGSLNATGSTVSLSGGSFAGSTCTVQYNVQLPASPTAGSYTNTISDIAATIGSPITGVTASASLQVTAAPTGNADLSITKTDNRTSIAPGEPVTYAIVVANAGPADDPAAVVADTFSADLTSCTYTSNGDPRITGETASGSGNINDTISIPTGTSITYTAVCTVSPTATGTLSNTATVTSSVIDPNTGNNSATDSDTTLVPYVNAFATITDGATEIGAGGTVTYTVVANNAGPTTDPSVTMSSGFDALFSSCSYSAVAAGGATGQTGSGSGNISDTLSLPPSATVTYTALCQVPSGTAASTPISSSATATASLTDTVPGDDTASDTDTRVIRDADVYVTKSAGAAVAGTNVVYTTVAGNNGPTPDTSVSFADTFPPSLSFCSYSSVAAGGAAGNSSGSGNISDTLSLPSGSSVTYTASCAVPSNVTGSLVSTATVTPSEPDSDTANNSVTDTTAITQSADLQVTKTDGVTSVQAGGAVTYTIVASNAGPSDVVGASLTDTFDARTSCSYTSVAAGLASGNTALGSGSLSETLTLPVGSSVTYTAVCTVADAATGTLSNTATISSGISDPTPGNNSATDSDTAIQAANMSFSKAFSPTAVQQGGISTLTYTIDNSANLPTATGMAFTDTLPAGMVVATPASAVNSCGGTLTATDGASSVSLSGGGVNGGASCTLSVDVQVLGNGTSFPSTSGDLTSNLPTVSGALATLASTPASAPVVTKVFAPSTIAHGETTVATVTINNGANQIGSGGVGFTDTLPSGLVIAPTPAASTTCTGGTVTATAGAGSIALANGTIGASSSCTVTVTLRATSTGSLPNAAFNVTSTVLPTASGGAASLTVTGVAPAFSKVFAPASLGQGLTTVATWTIDNSANAIEASSLAFTDALPAGLIVGPTPNASTTCTGGTVTANNGASSVAYSGGTVAAGASCTVTATLRATGSGTLTNPAVSLTSSLLPAMSAPVDLTVTAAGAPVIGKAFAPSSIAQGETTVATVTIDNSANPINASSVAFTDALPAGLVVAATPNASTTCGTGAVTATAGASSFALFGGGVGDNASCTVTVTLRATGGGTLTNPAFNVTSSLATGTSSTVDLTVTPAGAPLITKGFAPATITQGETTVATVTINNSANAIEASSLAFTDALPVGLVVAPTPAATTTCGAGTVTANAGDASFALSGGAVAETASCSVTVTLRATGAGTLTNPAFDVTSSIATGTSATADLTVTAAAAPTVTKVFTPNAIIQGQTTVATITIDNSANVIEAASLAFTDALPAGLVVAATPGASTTCGGTVTATAGEASFALAGGTVAQSATCEVSVMLQATAGGTLTNPSFDVTSSLATSTAAAVDLTVTPAPPPGFTKAFAPSSLSLGETSTLTFTIDNTGSVIEAAGLTFTDTFPTGMIVSPTPAATNTCGGTFTANALDSSVALSGGTVALGASCTLSVDVRATASGDLVNTSGDLTSSLGTSAGPSATLSSAPIVITIGAGFQPNQIELFDVTDLVFTFTNAATLAQLIDFIENLPPGLVIGRVAAPSAYSTDPSAVRKAAAQAAVASTTCTGGTLTATSGGTQLSYTGGSVPASGSCEVRVQVTPTEIGDFSSLTGGAPLKVTQATRGFVTFNVVAEIDGKFSYASSNADLTFDIVSANGAGSQGPITTTAGSYSISVKPPVGQAITEMSCSDGDSTGDPTNMTYALNLAVLETVTCTLKTESSVQKTVDTINTFLTKRADLILSTEPSSARRLDRLKRGFGNASPLTFSNGDLKSMLPFAARGESGNYSFATSLLQVRQAAASARLAHGSHKDVEHVQNFRFDAWFEAHYKEFDTGTEEGEFLAAHVGADYLLSEKVLIGVMASFDRMNERSASANTTVTGDGWLIGPYMTAQLAPNLYFDGRIAGGTSTNKISPFNTYIDTFHTKRLLAMASLSGDFQRGNWTITPNASLSYFLEQQESYTDTTGATIPSQTVRLGQIKFGPTFTGRFEGAGGELYAPYVSLDAIYNIGSTTGVMLTNQSSASTDGWRGRIQTGVKMTDENGLSLGLGASYDGIGRDDFEAWGLTFDLEIPFYKPTVQ